MKRTLYLILLLSLSACDHNTFLGVQPIDATVSWFRNMEPRCRDTDCYFVVRGAPYTLDSDIRLVDRDHQVLWVYPNFLNPEHQKLNFPHSVVLQNTPITVRGRTYGTDVAKVTISNTGKGQGLIIDYRTKETIWNSKDVGFSDDEGLFYLNWIEILPPSLSLAESKGFGRQPTVLCSTRDMHRVFEATLDGQIVWQFGETWKEGSDDRHLRGCHGPQRILVRGRDGKVKGKHTLISDSENHRVLQVDQNGRIVWRWGPVASRYWLGWPRDVDLLNPDSQRPPAAGLRDEFLMVTDLYHVYKIHRTYNPDLSGSGMYTQEPEDVLWHLKATITNASFGMFEVDVIIDDPAGDDWLNGDVLAGAMQRIDRVTQEGEPLYVYPKEVGGCPPAVVPLSEGRGYQLAATVPPWRWDQWNLTTAALLLLPYGAMLLGRSRRKRSGVVPQAPRTPRAASG